MRMGEGYDATDTTHFLGQGFFEAVTRREYVDSWKVIYLTC